MTMHLDASITCAFGALMFGFTANIFLPSINTSACSKSPMALSSDSTQPPLISIGRPGTGAASALGAPITLAAATPAVVQINCRRDSPWRGRQQGQPEPNACVIFSSQSSFFYCAMLFLLCDTI